MAAERAPVLIRRSLGPLGHPGAGDLQRLRHGDRPVIVLAEKNDRAKVDRGEVEALVKIALAGGALTEADVAERPLPSPLQRQPDAGGLRNLRTHRARSDDNAATPAAEVAR